MNQKPRDMSFEIMPLKSSHESAVRRVSESNWNRDYVPDRFQKFLSNSNWHMFGVFEDGELLGYAALQEVEGAEFGWAKALRVRNDRQREGVGIALTKHCIKLAREKALASIRYCTSSRNEASMGLALEAGFSLVNKAGYFRLEPPYPEQPKPSPSIMPITANAKRVVEAVKQNSELIPSATIPIRWEFEDKDYAGLERISQDSSFNLITNENGLPIALYFISEFSRNSQVSRAHTLYSTDRSIFIDVVARLIDDLKSTKISRAAFFLGPRATEWSNSLLVVPDEYEHRRFLLYEKKL